MKKMILTKSALSVMLEPRIIEKNGVSYIPLSYLCEYFGFNYSKEKEWFRIHNTQNKIKELRMGWTTYLEFNDYLKEYVVSKHNRRQLMDIINKLSIELSTKNKDE